MAPLPSLYQLQSSRPRWTGGFPGVIEHKMSLLFTFAREWRNCPPSWGLLAIGSADTRPELERRLLSRLKPTKDRWRVDDGDGSKSSHRPIGSICVLLIFQRRSISSV